MCCGKPAAVWGKRTLGNGLGSERPRLPLGKRPWQLAGSGCCFSLPGNRPAPDTGALSVVLAGFLTAPPAADVRVGGGDLPLGRPDPRPRPGRGLGERGDSGGIPGGAGGKRSDPRQGHTRRGSVGPFVASVTSCRPSAACASARAPRVHRR